MTTVIESTTSAPRDWLNSRWRAPVAPRVGENQDPNATNDAAYDLRESRQQVVHSRHTHYDPLQVAIEDGLDSWARHAMASNGFGDLP